MRQAQLTNKYNLLYNFVGISIHCTNWLCTCLASMPGAPEHHVLLLKRVQNAILVLSLRCWIHHVLSESVKQQKILSAAGCGH